MLNNPIEYERMAMVEGNHWWYRVLHQRVMGVLKNSPPNVGGVPRSGEGVLSGLSILDAGCGTGGLLLKLQTAGYTNTLGTDISTHALKICTERELNVMQSDVRDLPQKLAGKTFDIIICNDVLCYFTMDEISDIIAGFKSLLNPGGLLIMNNPAHASFSGTHDIAVGIKTRFRPRELENIIMNYELLIMNSVQWPFLLSPLVYLVRKFQKKEQSDIDMPAGWINSILYSICKFEMKLFKHAPFGSSVFIVARIPNND
jgi:2-polyprenyl-3-methyl-5-hydroxy-6-metoxy-1,4-benzoquinol methylase